jgi:hypothetical protein
MTSSVMLSSKLLIMRRASDRPMLWLRLSGWLANFAAFMQELAEGLAVGKHALAVGLTVGRHFLAHDFPYAVLSQWGC